MEPLAFNPDEQTFEKPEYEPDRRSERYTILQQLNIRVVDDDGGWRKLYFYQWEEVSYNELWEWLPLLLMYGVVERAKVN